MLARRLVPSVVRNFFAAPAPVALMATRRSFASKESDDVDDDALFGEDFAFLDEFLGLDEGFADSVDFVSERDLGLLFSESYDKTKSGSKPESK